jgi:hypothetical protein
MTTGVPALAAALRAALAPGWAEVVGAKKALLEILVDAASGNCGSGTGRAMPRMRSPSGGRSTGSDGGRSPAPSRWKGERPWPT